MAERLNAPVLKTDKGEPRSPQGGEPEHCSGRGERPATEGRAGAKRRLKRRAMDGGQRFRKLNGEVAERLNAPVLKTGKG